MFKSILLVILVTNLVWSAPQTAVKNTNVDGRIVGGVNTTIDQYPYIVVLQQNDQPFCGGSIISSTWIVSAAHCVDEGVPGYSIRAGSTIRNSGGQVISVKRIINHPLYDEATIDYDISLIELDSPITIAVARPIGLAADDGPLAAGTTATITGWGNLWENGPSSTVLQVAQVPIVSQTICRAVYEEDSITDRMFCAGLLKTGGIDTCQGDSGGPLVANEVLTGVVSWGGGCAHANSPGVYASVPYLRAWIRENTGI